MLSGLTAKFSARARARRGELFRARFEITPTTRILDLGGAAGRHIESVLAGCDHTPANVYVADLDAGVVERARSERGYTPITITPETRLPFADREFDIVFCSSVIEHVTIPHDQVWDVRSASEFRARATARQRLFAAEVQRISDGYFVQTPNRWFPIESHTLLPFAGYLPRPLLLRVMPISNRFWIKRSQPNWNLLGGAEMRSMFVDGTVEAERLAGLTKSWIAIRERRSG